MNNKKCGVDGDVTSMANRVFKLEGADASRPACKQACADRADCVAMSGKFLEWCIGCKADLDVDGLGAEAFVNTWLKQLPADGLEQLSSEKLPADDGTNAEEATEDNV